MNYWHEVEPGTKESMNTIIEIPKGSRNKYEIDKETGLIALDRAMHTAQNYPVDYGFVPKTYWDDGDALDVIVLSSFKLAPGILVKVRPVGILEIIDSGDADDKVIGVPVSDPRWDNVVDKEDINPHTIKEISHFFSTYKDLQNKKVEVKSLKGKKDAEEAFARAIEMYKKEFNK